MDEGRLKKLKAYAGYFTAAVGVLTIIGNGLVFAYNTHQQIEDNSYALDEYDQRIADLEEKLDELVGHQRTQLRAAVDGTRQELTQLAIADQEIRGSVNAVQTEVRVRHGSMSTGGREAVREAAQDTDRRQIRASNAAPQWLGRGDPLAGLEGL